MHPSPIPIAIVGLNFGRTILAELQEEPAKRFFKVVAVCDLDAAKAEATAAPLGARAYASLDALLENAADIPVIGLFTGPVGRAGQLEQIIKAGHDVITTKPFELKPMAARQVLEFASAQGRLILLNSPSPRPSESLRQIQSWVDKYALGQPTFARGESVVFYHEQADGSWYDDPLRCPAAPIFRLGIYLINDLVHLMGAVRDVQVFSSRLRTARPTPDNAQLSLRFASGALGSIYASFCVQNGQQYANSLILHFERGTIYRNLDPFLDGTASEQSHLKLIAMGDDNEVFVEEWHSEEGSGAYPWAVFHEAVRARDFSTLVIDDIVHGVEVIQAMALAQESGLPQAVSA